MKIMKLVFAMIWAVPAFYLWNFLAPIYLPQLAPQYLNVPYWHVAGIFALMTIVKMMIFPHRYHRYYMCRLDKFRKFNRTRRHHGGPGVTDTYYHR